jgi:hypothetical protein
VLVVAQDATNPEVAALVDSVTFMPVIHLWHRPPYWGLTSLLPRNDAATAANIYFLLRFAFEHAEARAAIVLESDLEVSPDAYDYFKWAYENVARRPELRSRVMSINGYQANSDPTADAGALEPYSFTVWGWLCPSYSWPLLRDGWTWLHNWDIKVDQVVRTAAGKVCLSPLVSRVRNIGLQGGVTMNIHDTAELERWDVYLSPGPVDYGRHPFVVRPEGTAAAARRLAEPGGGTDDGEGNAAPGGVQRPVAGRA